MREEGDRPIDSNDKETNNQLKAEGNQETPKEVDFSAYFIRDLQEFEANNFKFEDTRRLFQLGCPSDTLKDAGFPNIPIVMTQSVIVKAVGNKKGKMDDAHELRIDNFHSLYQCVHHPILIMESATQKNAKIIITDIKDRKGETVIVPIHLNSQMANLKANVIASVYTKPNPKLGDLVVIADAKGEIWHVDKLKIKNWLKQVGKLHLLPKMLSQF